MWHAGSSAGCVGFSLGVARGLSCPTACGILLPGSRTELLSLQWKADSEPLDHQGSPYTFLKQGINLALNYLVASTKRETWSITWFGVFLSSKNLLKKSIEFRENILIYPHRKTYEHPGQSFITKVWSGHKGLDLEINNKNLSGQVHTRTAKTSTIDFALS